MRNLREHTALLICAFAGGLNGFSLAWPWSYGDASGQAIWYLGVLAVAIVYFLIEASPTAGQLFSRAFLFTTAWLGSTFWWLYVAMHQYAGLPSAMAAAAVVGLAAVLGLYYVIALRFFWQWRHSLGIWGPIVFSALWTAAELARGTWFTGFGWGAVGYSHVDGPLAFYAPWVGIYGVGGIAVLLACVMVSRYWRLQWRVIAVLVAFGVPLLVPDSLKTWTQSTGQIGVSLLQGNIPQDEKFEQGSGIPLALRWYGDQLTNSQSELTIAPETAMPLLPNQLPPGYWDQVTSNYGSGRQSLLIGIPLGDERDGYTNSLIGLGGKDQAMWRYNKHHLVPFGEFIPPMFRWFTQMMHIPLGDFESGSLQQTAFEVSGQKLAAHICYEDLFSDELGVRFYPASSAPNLFVNVSNIAWFGDTVAIDQHLNISRMRSLEFERGFARATNTGATAIVDHHAKVVAQLPRHTRGVLRGQLEGRSGITPYAWWVSRWGLWPMWCASLLVIAWAWRRNKVYALRSELGVMAP